VCQILHRREKPKRISNQNDLTKEEERGLEMSEEKLRLFLRIACKIRNGERVEPTIVTDYLHKGIVEGMSDEELLDVGLRDLHIKIMPEKRKELLLAMFNKRL
jgi:hypothetical protein